MLLVAVFIAGNHLRACAEALTESAGAIQSAHKVFAIWWPFAPRALAPCVTVSSLAERIRRPEGGVSSTRSRTKRVRQPWLACQGSLHFCSVSRRLLAAVRLALTGSPSGASVADIFQLLGVVEFTARLQSAAQALDSIRPVE